MDVKRTLSRNNRKLFLMDLVQGFLENTFLFPIIYLSNKIYVSKKKEEKIPSTYVPSG